MTDEKSPDDMIDAKEVAAEIGVHVSTVYGYLKDVEMEFPQGKKYGRGKRSPRRWLRRDITEWKSSPSENVA